MNSLTLLMRQIRLSSPEQIQKRLQDFTGKQVNIVLRNRTVLFGEIRQSDDTQVTFTNLRNERFSLPLQEISEVYLDIKD